ncbi:hypothetical protein [Saccharothrix syringae]|uniref:Uncharacterized protein n=1 Tax=Saccharothrix syringae TaxID=103733 RepID=A0A5Q0H3G5_SACSY|nr:hypothetical protein [Saccharothrix syringae]QFZ20455.1 hypothetical protein EKG83_26280 [Saccharothrix syringae]
MAVDATSPYRQAGQVLAISVGEILETDDTARGAEPSLDRLKLDMLMAIYNELRHGHDQAAAQAAAVVEQTKALRELAGEVDRLARHLGDR